MWVSRFLRVVGWQASSGTNGTANCTLPHLAFCLARSCAGVRRRPRSIFPPSSLTLLPLFESFGKGIKRMYQIEMLKSSRSRGKEGERLKAHARWRERERDKGKETKKEKRDAGRLDETVLLSPSWAALCIRSLNHETLISLYRWSNQAVERTCEFPWHTVEVENSSSMRVIFELGELSEN